MAFDFAILRLAVNETDGIKVQTRYTVVAGYTYQLSSNPYRAATSSAETDPTMGWTLSLAQNNGNVLTQTITVPDVGEEDGFAAVQTYNYDSLNRLEDATEMLTPNGGSATQSWKQTCQFDRYGTATSAGTAATPPKTGGEQLKI